MLHCIGQSLVYTILKTIFNKEASLHYIFDQHPCKTISITDKQHVPNQQ
jgi:hypothetical protein